MKIYGVKVLYPENDFMFCIPKLEQVFIINSDIMRL